MVYFGGDKKALQLDGVNLVQHCEGTVRGNAFSTASFHVMRSTLKSGATKEEKKIEELKISGGLVRGLSGERLLLPCLAT